MTTRKYSSRSQQTTLTTGISSTATTLNVVSGTALLGGITVSSGETFTVVIDPDTAIEEIVDVTAVSGNALTVTRGIDGSSGQEHSAGATVRHMAIGRDHREANTHAETTGTAHGLILSNVVTTTNTKTLTNKTLTSPTITSPAISGSPTITGLSNPTNDSDAANKGYVDTILESGEDAVAAAAAAASSASAASTSATNAASSASAASTSASNASTSASSASTSASTATTKASEASTSATNASTSAGSASTSATAAASSASSASTSATNAANSASAAASSASAAASSASAASADADSVASALDSVNNQIGSGIVRDMGSITTSDTTTGDWVDMTDVAAEASASAMLANDWATKTSGTVAGGEYSAKYHASAAATSATSATSSASSASTSASSASASASSASTSATNAASSATSAAASATTAAGFIPSMTGNSGKFLTTDGTSASWVSLSDWGSI